MIRKYHLSYDAIDIEKDFKDSYPEAKRYILCVLGNTGFRNIFSYCESTLILEYDSIQPNLFNYLKENLAKYFHYSVSLVSINGKGEEQIDNNQNIFLNIRLKREVKNLSCDNLGKKITNY